MNKYIFHMNGHIIYIYPFNEKKRTLAGFFMRKISLLRLTHFIGAVFSLSSSDPGDIA